MNAVKVGGHDLFSSVAWAGMRSEAEARSSVPGSVAAIWPGGDGAMVAYGPVETVDVLLDVLREKHPSWWEWRDENDNLLDRGSFVPSADSILSMPSVRAKVSVSDDDGIKALREKMERERNERATAQKKVEEAGAVMPMYRYAVEYTRGPNRGNVFVRGVDEKDARAQFAMLYPGASIERICSLGEVRYGWSS